MPRNCIHNNVLCQLLTVFLCSAAMYCVAELMGVFGSQVMSLVVEIVTICLKLYRTSSVVSITDRAYGWV